MSNTMSLVFNSVEETRDFSAEFSQRINIGTVIALVGDLGTGKTTFTQGFAQGLKIKDTVGSPTYKLVSEYKSDTVNLFHVDCYRLKNEVEFLNIGGESLLNPDGVTVIEWADRIADLLPEQTIRINFSRIHGYPNKRKIVISGLNA